MHLLGVDPSRAVSPSLQIEGCVHLRTRRVAVAVLALCHAHHLSAISREHINHNQMWFVHIGGYIGGMYDFGFGVHAGF